MIQNIVLTATLAITLAGHVGAETSSYGSFLLVDSLPNVLFLTGEVSSSESFELRRAMRDQEIRLVVTASPGGNLYEGLQIAAILNDRGIGTYIPEQGNCESSCANIFLGGSSRLLLGNLGVHQFFSPEDENGNRAPNSVTTAVTQYAASDIIGIMNEFDTPPFVYEKMFGTTEIYYFKASEKARLNKNIDDGAFNEIVEAVDVYLLANPNILTRPKFAPQVTESSKVDRAPSRPDVGVIAEDAARNLLLAINRDWSLPNDLALPRMAAYYADHVDFYGKTWSRTEVLQEKWTFAERWPLRSYFAEPTSVEVTCAVEGCFVDAVIRWQASSPKRNASASGYSSWSLELIYLDGRLVIASEAGKTIKRN